MDNNVKFTFAQVRYIVCLYRLSQGGYGVKNVELASALGFSKPSVHNMLKSLAEKIRDEGKEYITIYYGADISEKHAQKAADLFSDICPDADVNLINGGQPVYYYLISAE